ncbi:hypothetical protein [Microtetraspora glauca]|uniref:LPXTG cell wall anchor domain-containing protein n=1 Tax=Microtetraspora glauca TaxID=1996 RepID=A0ABV3G663_MICGL
MLKSKARRRIATKAAAGVASAAVLVGALSAVSALADSKPVTYKCTPKTGEADAVTHDFTVSLTSSVATATVGTQFLATLSITPGTTSTSEFGAPEEIPAGAWIQVQPSVVASVSPATGIVAMSTPSPSTSVTATVEKGATFGPLPAATVTITPSTGASSIVLTARDFKLNVLKAGAAGTAATSELLYSCAIATTDGAKSAPAVATIAVVTASASASSSSSTTPTPSTSASSPTPLPTHTVYKTVTAKPSKDTQVKKTPGGGAATGGGADAGPDGRMFVLTGTALVLAAATGGLMLRSRRRAAQR